MSKIYAIAHSPEVDALLDRLEQLSPKDWRRVYDRFNQHSDPQWTRINTLLIDAADGWDPFEGLSEQAHERLLEELKRQIDRVRAVAERVPERAGGDPGYRSKLHFAIGRLIWLAKKRDHIHSPAGKRAAAVVDGLFEGLLSHSANGARVRHEKVAQSATRGSALISSKERRQLVPATYDRLVAVWDTIEPKLLVRGGERRLTHGERLVHELFFRLDSEVRNGGIEQYLHNSAGDNVEHVKAYLAEIEAWPILEVLDNVCALFPGEVVPADRRRRVRLLEQLEQTREDFSNPLGEATERYAHGQPALYQRIVAYVNRHPADFAQSD